MGNQEFEIENQTLKKLIEWIRTNIEIKNPNKVRNDKIWEIYGGADPETANVLFEFDKIKWFGWENILNSPYFGRIDFREQNEKKTEIFYIGYKGFEGPDIQILDWRAPVASLFYQNIVKNFEGNIIYSPKGMIRCQLILKRRLEVQQGCLISVKDEFDNRNQGNIPLEENRLKVEEEVLIGELNKRGNPKLQDIVKTIQAEQDRLIRSPAEGVLIINGVAGSGKTSIAYHRIAYLIYPQTNSGINKSRIIVFGPNRLFTSYVKSLLPTLGVNYIPQVTFDDWALDQMGFFLVIQGKKIRNIKIKDMALNLFLNPNVSLERKRVEWVRAKLKSSLRFGKLLFRFVEYKKNKPNFPQEGFIIENVSELGLAFSFTKKDLNIIYDQENNAKISYRELRDRFLFRIRKLAEGNYERSINEKMSRLIQKTRHEEQTTSEETRAEIKAIENLRNRGLTNTNLRRQIIENVVNSVNSELERFFPTFCSKIEYDLFIANRQLIDKLNNDLFTKSEIDNLMSASTTSDAIDLEDLSGLFYLHLLGNGKNDIFFDHIVVDEAQDFSPLAYKCLAEFNPNKSMTLVGDLAQGILAHRGLDNWNQVEQAIAKPIIKVVDIDKNYRSTSEIVNFTNCIKTHFKGSASKPSLPFNRHGEKPRLVQVNNHQQMIDLIMSDIQLLIRKGIRNIAVIVKTPEEVSPMAQLIIGRNLIHHYQVGQITDRDMEYNLHEEVIVLPVCLAKGLEFSAVLIVDASEEKYHSNLDYDGRLLYVAATRALHKLYIYFSGKLTGYLKEAENLVDNQVFS